MDKSEKTDKAQAEKAKTSSALSATPAQIPAPMQQTKKKQPKQMKRKFEIAVYDVDEVFNEETGQVIARNLKPVPTDPMHPTIIEVSSKKEFDELAKTYQMTGQQIKIIRELTPSTSAPEMQQMPAAMPAQAAELPIAAPAMPMIPQAMPMQAAATSTEPKKMKPKKFTVGDVQFKYDGEKMYQRQWIKLSPKEAANFRVIADSSNKIVNLNGKHIEALKWIAVDYSADDDAIDASIDAIIEGD